MGEWMVLLFAISKKYDKVLYTPHNWLSPSLNNCHLHEISLFFVLSTYVEIILMRWLQILLWRNSAKLQETDCTWTFSPAVNWSTVGFCHFIAPGPMAPYSCFKNSEKWRCSVFVNLYVLRALFCQAVFSIFEFYADNYAFVFAFEH